MSETLKIQKLSDLTPMVSSAIEVGNVDLKSLERSNLYVVLLINMTDYCMKLGRINNGNWFAIPTVCRTCSDNDPNVCFDNKKYAAVMTCSCSDAPFNLTLSTAPDGQGNGIGATWSITPDCKYAGGVIALA